MDNFTKLGLLKHESKNFTSVKGRKIYFETIKIMDEIRHDGKLWVSDKVTRFLEQHNFFIKKYLD